MGALNFRSHNSHDPYDPQEARLMPLYHAWGDLLLSRKIAAESTNVHTEGLATRWTIQTARSCFELARQLVLGDDPARPAQRLFGRLSAAGGRFLTKGDAQLAVEQSEQAIKRLFLQTGTPTPGWLSASLAWQVPGTQQRRERKEAAAAASTATKAARALPAPASLGHSGTNTSPASNGLHRNRPNPETPRPDADSAHAVSDDGTPCPHCGYILSTIEVQREAGRRANKKRKVFAGGRPRQLDRCPCGKYTLATAKKRGHVCTPKPARDGNADGPTPPASEAALPVTNGPEAGITDHAQAPQDHAGHAEE